MWMVLAGVVVKTEGGGGGEGWRYRTVHTLPKWGGLDWLVKTSKGRQATGEHGDGIGVWG